ncbi:NAD(P)/FAD-dependent oxidoreductase [Streptomyces sp. OE57]|uniref:NAD(P)/FAD-dependent oxidoreductase n=1 Tax=Streptomyces lacaronensis TaxID=3379885 RepID=UPI0039B74A82
MERFRRVVVVGASVAGVQTAESLRQLGYDGELVVIDGDKEFPYNRPPLSKELITGELDEEDIRLLTPEMVNELDIELQLGTWARGLTLEEKILDTSGGALSFDGLVIATGAVPVLPEPWATLEGVTALRTLDDARTIRAALGGKPSVVVIGGGFIGCEIAASVRQESAEVTIVEAAPTLMSRVLDPRTSAPIARLHKNSGVSVRCGTRVAGLSGSGRVEAVELGDGTRIEADLVVVGLGARPATGWLASSGIELQDGVCADATLSAAPGVYAVGDVVRHRDGVTSAGRRVEHWTSAREHGVLAAANLLDPVHARPVSGLPFIWSNQHGRRIQIVGEGSGEQVRFVDTADGKNDGYLAFVGGPQRVTGLIAFDRPKQFRKGRRLLEAGADWATVRDTEW